MVEAHVRGAAAVGEEQVGRSDGKKAGYLENSTRGVWALVRPDVAATFGPARVVADVRSQYGRGGEAQVAEELPAPPISPTTNVSVAEPSLGGTPGPELAIDDAEEWRGALMRTLLAMPAPAFERLTRWGSSR